MPRLVYTHISRTRFRPATKGCCSGTNRFHGKNWPPCVWPDSCKSNPAAAAAVALKEAPPVEGLEWLEATPRARDGGFDWIRIGFRDGLPAAMEVRDAFGQVTRFGFRAIERNPSLDASLFRFTPPKGVDVVQ